MVLRYGGPELAMACHLELPLTMPKWVCQKFPQELFYYGGTQRLTN
jgi:hypothetical protein